jgi:hypothetical protein
MLEQHFSFQFHINLTTKVPRGFAVSEHDAKVKLLIGMQVVARQRDEETILNAVVGFEGRKEGSGFKINRRIYLLPWTLFISLVAR